ncbi:MAG: hypothetical protein OXP09_02290 [Gammaproteobacteria bacterium]|nr:hypothetical protein [Gammaproteobacteria bacterium]
MAVRKKSLEIVLIEGISDTDRGQEMPILKEFFGMLDWECKPRKAHGLASAKHNRAAFLEALLQTKSRFVHVSAHGSGSDLTVDRYAPNEARTNLRDIMDFCQTKGLRAPLSGRFVTISACGDIAPSYALGLHKHAEVTAVITPLASLDFHESALFTMMFYFTLLAPPGRKKVRNRSERLAQYIDSFNRTKIAYLNVGGSGAHRLDYWWRGEHTTIN